MAVRRAADMALVAPLFAGWPEYMLRAALDGEMGEAYINDSHTAALIYVASFGFLAGDASAAEAESLAKLLPEGHGGGVRVWVPHNAAWADVIERALGSSARKAQRYAIRKDTHHFDKTKLRALAGSLPAGFALRAIDAALYHQALANAWSRDLVAQFRSEADFLARGVGVVALLGDEIVAGASSYVVFRGGIEVEIDTRRDHRRRGLAAACGAQLLLACFARGLYPSWDAHNTASVALAEKLGYVFDRPYWVYEVDAEADEAPL